MKLVPWNRYAIFFAVAVAGCLADLATKSWIFNLLGIPGGRTLWIWRGVFGFQTAINEGALFGLGQGGGLFFAALSFVAALIILTWLFVFGAAQDRWLNLVMALVMAGIGGNLYDRLGLHGIRQVDGQPMYAVRDWIFMRFHFYWWTYDWPNYNIADSLLVVGVAMIAWHAFRHDAAIVKDQALPKSPA